jgi:arylsulfatase A-like enzyme
MSSVSTKRAAATAIAGFGLVSFALGVGLSAVSPATPVLLVTLDTVRADHLSAYGYSRATSPHLERLAAGGARFTRAVATAPWTPPSLFSLLTGTHAHQHNVVAWGDRPAEGIPTFVEHLRAAGYRTAAFNNHDVFFAAQPEIAAGFDRLFSRSDGEFPAELVVDRAIEWLRQNRGAPFFLWVHLFDPHEPFTPPPPYNALWDGEPQATERRAAPVDGGFGAGGIPRLVYEGAGGENRIERIIAAYDGEIRYTDEQVGRLLSVLADLGLAQDTLVVVTADHGEILERSDTPYHGTVYFSHGTYLFEDLLAVPLIVRYPARIPARRNIDIPVGLVDVAPTILEAARLDASPAHRGRSLLRFFSSPPSEGPLPVLSEELRNNWQALTWGRFKLIRYGPSRVELYDLQDDPRETRDIASQRPEVARALSEEMNRLTRTPASAARDPRPLDGAILERLRALGYAQ